MELCLFTDSAPHLSFEEALDLAVRIGATTIEIAGGGQSSAPHLPLDELLESEPSRRSFQEAFDRRGLRIAALNCSAWPLHPVIGEAQREIIRKTIRLAELLGVTKIVSMSGTTGDGPGATTINWLWYPGPEDHVALLERQWDETIATWRELGAFALDHGVTRVCFELHPQNVVYNVPTFRRLHDAVGEPLAVNLDPSHFFWQGIDPIASIRALGSAVGHAHLKDTEIDPAETALAGVLDDRPFAPGAERSWQFRTVGAVHDAAWWRSFIATLQEVGYDDVVSIENEDLTLDLVAGVERSAEFIRPILR
ncbi:MAG TPA: sugar phosphate isomerase/epimerase [Candidatus Limnocylindrales bacterium]|nr:sugar phosphate isomerase/epimerase [Candidatus Limnocylindrales bacterium]